MKENLIELFDNPEKVTEDPPGYLLELMLKHDKDCVQIGEDVLLTWNEESNINTSIATLLRGDEQRNNFIILNEQHSTSKFYIAIEYFCLKSLCRRAKVIELPDSVF